MGNVFACSQIIKNKYLSYCIGFPNPNANAGRDPGLGIQPSLKKAIIRFHFQQCLLLSSPLAKKLKAIQAYNGCSEERHANSWVLILTKTVTILDMARTPEIKAVLKAVPLETDLEDVADASRKGCH